MEEVEGPVRDPLCPLSPAKMAVIHFYYGIASPANGVKWH
jgi:hypothetical protein